MNIDIKTELKRIILSTDKIKNTYAKTYPHTKYTLDHIIDELLYFFKSGVSWKMLRSDIRPITLYWHFTRFVKNNVFTKLLTRIQNKFRKQFTKINNTFYID